MKWCQYGIKTRVAIEVVLLTEIVQIYI